MFQKTLKRAGFGFLLGMAVGNLIAAATGHPGIVSPALLERAGGLSGALLWQTLLSGVIGGAAWAGISLYEIERWSLLRAVAVHYASIMAVFLPVGFFLGWLGQAFDVLLMAAIMAAAHFLIFLIMCAIYRAQVRELNALNEQRKKRVREQQAQA